MYNSKIYTVHSFSHLIITCFLLNICSITINIVIFTIIYLNKLSQIFLFNLFFSSFFSFFGYWFLLFKLISFNLSMSGPPLCYILWKCLSVRVIILLLYSSTPSKKLFGLPDHYTDTRIFNLLSDKNCCENPWVCK